MYLIRSTPITDKVKTFNDFDKQVCKTVFEMPADQIDVAGDRYDTLSTTECARNSTARKTKSTKQKIKKIAVEKIGTPES